MELATQLQIQQLAKGTAPGQAEGGQTLSFWAAEMLYAWTP